MSKTVNTYLDRDLLRFSTAGSVDDGKSTLIGRLLFDSKSIFEDQLASIEGTSKKRGLEHIDLSLLTDGLKDEREQGITIDVAYRYFSTPKRKFIIADTPGHIQYTRNMVTGASTSNATIILIDARNGVVEQTKRHTFIASLLNIPHLIVCINKMDLVDYSEERYKAIIQEFKELEAKLTVQDIRFVPISALVGDNVVDRSSHMDWYDGATLLHTLENIPVSNYENMRDFRLPVQTVIRPHKTEYHDFRAYAGRIAGGVIREGDEVVSWPGGLSSKVKAIHLLNQSVPEAFAGQSVSLELEDDIDVSRGDVISKVENTPDCTQDIDAMLCWMGDTPMVVGKKYSFFFNGNEVKAMVKQLVHEIDVNTFQHQEGNGLKKNGIGRVVLRLAKPVAIDAYAKNRNTGSFILVEDGNNATVAAGMIR